MKHLLLLFFIFPSLLLAEESEPNNLVIDQIICSGNESTSCELIQKEIYLNPGDLVNEEELQNAKIRLQLRNLFTSVNLSLRKGSQRGHVDLVVEVVEATPLYTETTFYLSPFYGKMAGEANYTLGSRNLLGQGKVLQGTIGINNIYGNNPASYKFGLTYTDPHLLNSKKWYYSIGANQTEINWKSDYDYSSVSYSKSKSTLYSANLGLRIFDLSYISVSTLKSIYSSDRRYDGELNSSRYEEDGNAFEYGWNSEDDTYFATSGDRFRINYTKWNRPGPFYEDSGILKLDYKKNWNISTKSTWSLNLQSVYQIFQSEGNYFILPGFDYAYKMETEDNRKSRFLISFLPVYTFNTFSAPGIEAGFLIDHKTLGILKLTLGIYGVSYEN